MVKDKTKKKKRKKAGKKGKGSKFEREICKMLSRWWSKNATDDIFWRTSGSGARAKTRSKTNRATFGQYGDVQATNPVGQPLINLCTIELKRGYSQNTMADLVEPLQHFKPKPGIYESFIRQAIFDSQNAKTPFWMLIVKRDRREAFVLIPMSFYNKLKYLDCTFRMLPKIKMKVQFTNKRVRTIFGTTLSNFLSQIKPAVIRVLSDNITKRSEKKN